MEDYYQTSRQKRIDFFEGILTNLIVGIFATALYFVFWGITFLFDYETVKLIIRIIGVATVVTAVVIYEVRKIRKYLKGRRYIAIGMIVALILPLLVIGTCSPFIFYN